MKNLIVNKKIVLILLIFVSIFFILLIQKNNSKTEDQSSFQKRLIEKAKDSKNIQKMTLSLLKYKENEIEDPKNKSKFTARSIIFKQMPETEFFIPLFEDTSVLTSDAKYILTYIEIDNKKCAISIISETNLKYRVPIELLKRHLENSSCFILPLP